MEHLICVAIAGLTTGAASVLGYRIGKRAGLSEAHRRDRALIRKSREDAHLVQWRPPRVG